MTPDIFHYDPPAKSPYFLSLQNRVVIEGYDRSSMVYICKD